MYSPSKKVFYAGHTFRVWEHVYEPAEDSFLFAENLVVNSGECVLDMGTGCGILGILAAAIAAKVVAVDVNPYAVKCAKENARLNQVADRMLFIQGDLFAPLRVEEKFDLVLFNAPYLPVEHGKRDSWLERAWAGGATGRETIDRFTLEASQHLKRNGRILLMRSRLLDLEESAERFNEHNLNVRIVARRSLPFFEEIQLLRENRLV